MANPYYELNGATIAFGTSTNLNSAQISIKLPELSTKEIDITTLADAVQKSFPSAVIDHGQVTVALIFDPTVNYPAAVGKADESITINLPKQNTGSANGAKFVFNGHIAKYTRPEAANGTRAVAGLTIQVNSVPVFTAES